MNTARPAGASDRRPARRYPLWLLRTLALLLVSLTGILILLFVETCLTLLRPDPGLAAIRSAIRSGLPYDPRTRKEVVQEMQRRGIDAVPRLVPSALLRRSADGQLESRIEVEGRSLLPLAGIARRYTVLCAESGQYVGFQSDGHGFRNPPDLWTNPPVDFLLLGDSFTLGECVPDGYTIADQLRDAVPSTLNLGYSGNSPLFQLATLIEYGAHLAPRSTLWLFFENDLAPFDLSRSAMAPELMRYLEPNHSQSLMDRQASIDHHLERMVDSFVAQPDDTPPSIRSTGLLPTVQESVYDLVSFSRLRRALSRWRAPGLPASAEPDLELLARILARARSEVARWDGDLVVVFLPGVWRYDWNASYPRWASPEVREHVEAIASETGLSFIDLSRTFEAHPDPLSLYSYRGVSDLGRPHMNGRGYAVVAARILDFFGRAPEPDFAPIGEDSARAE